MSILNTLLTTGQTKPEFNSDSSSISLESFLLFIVLDIGFIVLTLVLWRMLWYSINKLSIWDIKQKKNMAIGSQSRIYLCLECLFRIGKSIMLMNNEIINKCGFEAFTYLFFLRRFMHLMSILMLTDLFIWIPYQLFFLPIDQFSLVTMRSQDNDIFRTFYTLWTAMVILNGIHSMKNYLQHLLRYRLFRKGTNQKKLLNNMKAKTILIHFVNQDQEITSLNLKTKLIQDLKIQDRLLAFLKVQNYTKELDIIYRNQIQEIVKNTGIQNMSCLWKFFKAQSNQEAQRHLQQSVQKYFEEKEDQRMNGSKSMNSYFVVFENITTAQQLCKQFETTRAIQDFLPSFGYDDNFEEEKNVKMIVKWAQQPLDIIWINMGPSERVQILKFVLFNLLSFMLVILSFYVVLLSKSQNVVKLPEVWGPFLLIILNSTIRFLISKTTEWENRLFQYELQIKEFKILAIYFVISTLINSIVRDTLNLTDILKNGWGFLELISLIYRKPDGYFYYLYIINEVVISIFSLLVKAGDLFADVYNSKICYEKAIKLKHKSKFGTNDPFRYGYYYAMDFIVLSMILMYSVSNPLIHSFGMMYFIVKFYLYTYTLAVFHKEEEMCSNLRLIEKVCEFIQVMVIGWIVLTATTMMFANSSSNVLILYAAVALIIYYVYNQPPLINLQDYITDEQLLYADVNLVVEDWRKLYMDSMVSTLPPKFNNSNSNNNNNRNMN